MKRNTPCSSANTCLIPIEKEQEIHTFEQDATAVIACVPSNYRTLAQRVAQAKALFEGWLDHVVKHALGRMPDPKDVDNAIVSIMLKTVPNLFREPVHLILLALEEPTLATKRPTSYGDLVEANGEAITATLLLWCALADHVIATLGQCWQKRLQ